MLELNKIYNGNCLEVLKNIPDDYINCVVTSPPYWALRDYGISVESIWDTENSNCVFAGTEHEFEEIKTAARGGIAEDSIVGANRNGESNNRGHPTITNFCSKCGAWKGQLGLEPTFDLYIKHLCDIFDEVKRVLRKDGTCWVNLGDCYSGNMGKKSGWTDNKLGFTKEEAIEKGVCLTKETKFNYTLPQKCLCCIPERFVIEMINPNWILREDLTEEEKDFVIKELINRKVFK